MCDDLSALIEQCEPLIRQGRFDELDGALQAHEPHAADCLPCRHQGEFYRAVWLSYRQHDYDLAQLHLAALAESDQVDLALRNRALNFGGIVAANFQSRYSQALKMCQQAFDLCLASADRGGQARALFNQAIIYNNYLSNQKRALMLLDRAEALLQEVGHPLEIVRLLNERGLCLIHLARWDEARAALDESHRLCREQENPFFTAICETNLGSWARLQGRWAEAARWYTPLPAFFEQIDNPWFQAEVLFYLGEVAQAQGNLDQAGDCMNQVLRLAESNNSPHFTALAYLGLARLASGQGNWESALELYRRAVREIEQIRAAQGVQDVRLNFQTQWNSLYREAMACALQLERIEDSLLFSEHARARLLLDTLGVPADVPRPDAPPALLAESENLEQSLHALYVQQTTGSLEPAAQTRLHAHEARMAQVRTSLYRYDQEMLPFQGPPDLRTIQQTLPEGTALVSYFASGHELFVFVMDQSMVRQQKLPISPTQLKARLTPEGQLRDIVPDRYTGRLSPHLGILPLLYSALLAPITGWIADYRTYYLVPDNDLRHIPFHLLTPNLDQPCPLTEGDRRLAYLPSASILTRIPLVQITDDLLVVGYNGPDLHLVEAHAQQVTHVTGSYLLYGDTAQRKQVVQDMNQRSQVYFAGHNLFRSPAPADCGLFLANDRLLTLLDIQRLRLPGSRVVLGTCQSGLVAEHGGDWIGLTSAFLQVGASQIVATLWPVSEIASCLFMDQLWVALTNNPSDLSAALRQAQGQIRSFTIKDIERHFANYELTTRSRDYVKEQLAVLQAVLSHTEHPLDHPFYWAPFVTFGTWGR